MDPLCVDLYSGDGRNKRDMQMLQRAGGAWSAVCLKATEGVGATYFGDPWFRGVWPDAHAQMNAAREWWAMAYHYWRPQNAKAQAYTFLREIELAGGWKSNTGPAWIDVERAGQPKGVTAAQVVESVSQWVDIVKRESGRNVWLYGGEYLRSLGVKYRMGCSHVVVAAYTPTLPARYYTDIGFDLASLGGWQYCGDGEAYLAGYPYTTPLGPEDITALTVNGGGEKALNYFRNKEYLL